MSGSRVYKLTFRKIISEVSKIHQRIALWFFGKNNKLKLTFRYFVRVKKDWTASDENGK